MLFSCGSAINIWDIAQPIVPRTFSVSNGPVKSIDFNSKTGKAYFCTHSTKLFELDIEKEIITETNVDMEELCLVKLSPNGDTILLSDKRELVALYKIDNFPTIERIASHRAHKNKITAIAIPKNPDFFFAADEQGKISTYNIVTKKAALLPGWTSKYGSVKAMIYDPIYDNLIIATDIAIYIKSPYERSEAMKFPLQFPSPTGICISPKLPTVFGIGFENGHFSFVKKTDGAVIHTISQKGKIQSIDIDDHGEYVAISAEGDNNYLIQTKELKPTFVVPYTEHVILRLIPYMFTPSSGASSGRHRRSVRSTKVEESKTIKTVTTTITKETKAQQKEDAPTHDDEYGLLESSRRIIGSAKKPSSVRSSAYNPTTTPSSSTRQRRVEQEKAVDDLPKKELNNVEELEKNILLHPKTGSVQQIPEDSDDDDNEVITLPKRNVIRSSHEKQAKETEQPKASVMPKQQPTNKMLEIPKPNIPPKKEESPVNKQEPVKSPEPKKQTPNIRDTPPRMLNTTPTASTETFSVKKKTTQKPLQKVIISDSDSDDSSVMSDVPEGPLDNKGLLKHLTTFVNDKFDNMSQQMNTIYLDILCRMRNLEERVASIEKSIGGQKK